MTKRDWLFLGGFCVALSLVFCISLIHSKQDFKAQTPAYTCSAGQAMNSQLANTGQSCGNPVPSPATASTVGGVTLATGQTSSALATVATTGAYADLSGLPTIPVGPLKATTPSLGGTLISLGCTNQTAVTVTGATTAMACNMSAAAGNPANTVPICSVTAANTVVPELCTAIALGVTPTAKTYNIVLF